MLVPRKVAPESIVGRATHAYGMIIHRPNATAAIRPMQARTKPPRCSIIISQAQSHAERSADRSLEIYRSMRLNLAPHGRSGSEYKLR